MRIISGIYKGRKLKSSKNLHIRPTTDRVKEYIFNILQDFPKNKMACDIFSGSGNLGIEALSRGAREIYFVDNSNDSMKVLKNNLHTLQIPESNYRIVLSDAVTFVKNNKSGFDLYLLDPPFDYPPLQRLIDNLFKNDMTTNESMVVLEHEISNPVDNSSGLYQIIKQKKFGRSLISFIIKKGNYEN
jgi:16S rRNA (guanine(966)-N(2))-methyltransferase RsmD